MNGHMLAALAALLATEARAQTGTTPIGIEQGDYLCVRTPHATWRRYRSADRPRDVGARGGAGHGLGHW